MPAITVRNVPDETRNTLAARAAQCGQSLQEYLRSVLIELARKRSPAEVLAEARARVARSGTQLPAEEILELRDADRR